MKFSHWLERRDKHEVMRAINSRIRNASSAPSSNQRGFIYEIELQSFERALGEFFHVFRKDYSVHFNSQKKLFSPCWNVTILKSKSVVIWCQLRSHALRMYVGAMKQCFIEVNLDWMCNWIEPLACYHSRKSVYILWDWLVCAWNSIKRTLLFLRKDGNI